MFKFIFFIHTLSDKYACLNPILKFLDPFLEKKNNGKNHEIKFEIISSKK